MTSLRSPGHLLPALLLATLAACGGGAEQGRAPAGEAPGGGVGSGAGAPSPVPGAGQVTTDAGGCPADGRWHPCSLRKRLEMSGFVLLDSTAEVAEPPLTRRGTQYRIGQSTLVLFFYPDEGARVADEARLDTARFVPAPQALSLRGEATRIGSANLLAILRSRNDHQRERVADALTAGPPQAGGAFGKPSVLPPTASEP
ncbi:MAG TPA: hypothetical protein VEA99_13830 [Gemmatimonadaceae bacterium]|nr:hypothetical protein [Gemmatimonadaceae bacterium]